MFHGFSMWCIESTFLEAVDAVPGHVPSRGWMAARVAAGVCASFTMFMSWYEAKDVDNAAADIGVIKGLAGGVISECGHVLLVAAVVGPEWYRLFRMRNVKLPPHNIATWYKMANTKAGRPTYYAAITAITAYVLWEGMYFLVAFLSFSDKAGTTEWWCNGNLCYFTGKPNYVYFPVLITALIASVVCSSRAKWPPQQRDLPAAALLCHFQYAMCYLGSFMAVTLYAEFGDASGGSTLGVQIGELNTTLTLWICVQHDHDFHLLSSVMEFITLVIYLYARFLSRRAFGGDASKEARSVFAFLLFGDIFAEIAFINVDLYSREFWTLVFLDFFM